VAPLAQVRVLVAHPEGDWSDDQQLLHSRQLEVFHSSMTSNCHQPRKRAKKPQM
jgi:hypothetical protein